MCTSRSARRGCIIKYPFLEIGGGGTPLFARWTEDFDCNEETEFWYTILDHPFDISQVKSKHRYYIKQGMKNFDVRRLNREEFEENRNRILEILNNVRVDDYHLEAAKDISIPASNEFYLGAFEKDTDYMVGWALITEYEGYASFTSLKALPEYEKKSINAAIVYALVELYKDRFGKNFYISNGTRTINHPTQFNAYLRRMFEFRKAYCRLRIRYRWFVKPLIIVLYCFRTKIEDKGEQSKGLIHQIAAVLRMEEIARSCRE